MTSAQNPKTIELYGHGIQHEAEVTDAVVTPGMLVVRTATGVRPHNVAGFGAAHVAVEYGMVGRGIDDDYAIGDQATFKTYQAGSGVYALLDDGNDVSAGDFLISAGDGTLELQAADSTAVIVAQAMEAVNSGASVARIQVELVAPFTRTLPA